jgi:hypothetical protein
MLIFCLAKGGQPDIITLSATSYGGLLKKTGASAGKYAA